MASTTGRQLRYAALVLSLGRHRVTRYLVGATIAAASLLGVALPAVAATPSTLAVVVVGGGSVLRRPPPGSPVPGRAAQHLGRARA